MMCVLQHGHQWQITSTDGLLINFFYTSIDMVTEHRCDNPPLPKRKEVSLPHNSHDSPDVVDMSVDDVASTDLEAAASVGLQSQQAGLPGNQIDGKIQTIEERLSRLEMVVYGMDKKLNTILQILTKHPGTKDIPGSRSADDDTSAFENAVVSTPVINSTPAVAADQKILPSYKIVDAKRDIVAIGRDKRSSVRMQKQDLDHCFIAANSPIAFALKLVGKLYSRTELVQSNYAGGAITLKDGSKVFKKPLDKVKLQAIIYETQYQFPGSLGTYNDMKQFRDAVNGKCRHTKSE